METLWQDVRFSLRMMRRSPSFVAITVLILAVAISANTALFSVVNAVMLRPLPYKDPHRIVRIKEQGIPWKEGFRFRPNFLHLRAHNQVFEALGGSSGYFSYVRGIERPREVWACEVTGNLFSLLGVEPVLGRGFVATDEKPDSAAVIVLSDAFWKEHFGGAPDAIRKSVDLTRGRLDTDANLLLDRRQYTVVGVMPPGFDFPLGRSVPFWTPIVFDEGREDLYPTLILPFARLKRGVTLGQASAELAVVLDRLRPRESTTVIEAASVRVERLLQTIVEGHRKLPLLLLGAAGFVLLIACANVASLFLARATVRQREMAMRMALGASRARLMRQMLTESLLLSLAAGLLALVLTFGTVRGLVRLCPADIPRLQETSVDLQVLAFTLGVSVLTGLLFGMMPAWRTSDIGVNETLKEGTGRIGGSRGWRRLHDALVVSQLGLSLVLLIGAALLIRSLIGLATMDLGFRPENVLVANIQLPDATYPDEHRSGPFFAALLERLQGLPGVRSVAMVYNAYTLTDTASGEVQVSIPGHAKPTEDDPAKVMEVSPDFFRTMGLKLLRGRTFTDRDEEGIVIDEVLARRYFPDRDPVGQRLNQGEHFQSTILGVVTTTRDLESPDATQRVVYRRGRVVIGLGVLLVRTDGDPVRLAPAVRGQVAELEKDQVIKKLEPLQAALSAMLAPRRFVMILLGIFAGIALALATVGIYGLLQYSTARQTHDIGIRMALGARRGDVLRTVLAQGLKLALIGVVVGVGGALAVTRVLSSFLYDVTPTDPLTLAAVSVILVTIALVASYIPARRAARIDPMVALRYE